MRAIAIDFETANELRSSPCAIGLAWIEDGEITRRAYTLIRPPVSRFAYGNIRIHGIRPEDVADAPDFPTAIAPFLDEFARQPILAHNAGFDIAVLRATATLTGTVLPQLTYLCTRAAAKAAWPTQRAGLAAVAGRLGITFKHHHAGEDAETCARVALAAAETVGTRHVTVMAERLALRPGFSDGRTYVPAGTFRMERRKAPPPKPAPLAFRVAGSGGATYDITGDFTRSGYALRCGCRAAEFRRRCRHVESLLDGEVSGLVSENFEDLRKLQGIVQALGCDAIEPAVRAKPMAVAA